MIKKVELALDEYRVHLRRCFILEQELKETGKGFAAGNPTRRVMLSREKFALQVIERTLRLTEGEKTRIREREKVLRAIVSRS